MRALSKMSLCCVGDHHSLLQSLGSLVLMQLSLLALELLQVSWLSLFSVSVIIIVFLQSLGTLLKVSWLFRWTRLVAVSWLFWWTRLVAISWRSWWSLLSVSVNLSCCRVLAPSIVSVLTCECDVRALIPSRKDLHQIHKAYFTGVSTDTTRNISRFQCHG